MTKEYLIKLIRKCIHDLDYYRYYVCWDYYERHPVIVSNKSNQTLYLFARTDIPKPTRNPEMMEQWISHIVDTKLPVFTTWYQECKKEYD